MEMINRKLYPELDLLLWDMHNTYVEPETAFRIYEERWRYVDKTKISESEERLIADLVKDFGGGIFMPA
ncbi:hypothetical protein IDAT_05415 [Pseudidiomarina atlantica]|jgi:hypothetical protein|uniref:Uncharacterized protein n=1 Tax=Pseudidiomarina atlantica TaxID=1517416 RepID=A0A094ITD2_9GAMM|nr:hypothetical protein [Pseudidiomarina atlantica]KFZ29114.1 hypothetical protein IDAT_05415 [Pseudidiomarina atlantica]